MSDKDDTFNIDEEMPDIPELDIGVDDDEESLLDDMPEIPF